MKTVILKLLYYFIFHAILVGRSVINKGPLSFVRPSSEFCL
jgi:hypothetical protein